MNRTQITILLLLIAAMAHGQTMVTATHNSVRPTDELRLQLVGAAESAVGPESFVLELSRQEDGETAEWTKLFATDIAEDTLTTIFQGCRSYYVEHDNEVMLCGVENPQLRIVYDRPEAWLRFPMMLGDSLTGYFHGVGSYCEQLAVRKLGSFATLADAEGTIVTPDGDSLRHALRLHTRRQVITLSSPIDTLHKALAVFTLDSICRHLSADSVRFVEDACRYYMPGYRYPVVERSALLSDDGATLACTTYYFPPEMQAGLPLDETNLEVRRSLWNSNADAGQTTTVAAAKPYAATTDEAARTITVKLALGQPPVGVSLQLCNVQGMPLRSVSSQSVDVGQPLSISYGGLRPGQYVLHVQIEAMLYSEKFVVS